MYRTCWRFSFTYNTIMKVYKLYQENNISYINKCKNIKFSITDIRVSSVCVYDFKYVMSIF